MAKKQILEKAQGKHIGHAVEGHCRGLFDQICAKNRWTLARQLPFEFPIETDIVVLDGDGQIRSLGIVIYTSDSGESTRRLDHSTHKFYRTRIEYNEIARAYGARRQQFSPQFVPIVVIYGSPSSWKPQLLSELDRDCPVTLFLPSAIGNANAEGLVDQAFQIYRVLWEEKKNNGKVREAVEAHFSKRSSLSKADIVVLDLLDRVISDKKAASKFRARPALPVSAIKDHIRPDPFISRLRQGLSLLSLFSDKEISAWSPLALAQLPSTDLDHFLRRALFLDLVKIETRKTLKGAIQVPLLRTNRDGRGELEPHRPDFSDWTTRGLASLLYILRAHRLLPIDNTSFESGGSDQAFGAWHSFARNTAGVSDDWIAAVKQGSVRKLQTLLSADVLLRPGAENPCSTGNFGFRIWWSILVSALATLTDSRAVFREYGFRVSEAPDTTLARQLLGELVAKRKETADLIAELAAFSNALLSAKLNELAGVNRPTLLSLDVSTSWTSAAYLAMTTNPSHNPLNIAVSQWLNSRFPSISPNHWVGFPKKRSVPVREILGDGNCRIEWAFGAVSDTEVVFVESRSITANNLGNKTKELYDRLSQTRSAASAARRDVRCIAVMDGDFTEDVLSELASDIGYDEIYSIDEILEVLDGI